MLRNFVVVGALVFGLFCVGVIVNADTGEHVVSLGAPTFIASAAWSGE